ncbi:MAG: 3-ketoacyl-ACP reductase [Bacteroidota bacterium]|jgi:NAD(P)-dependent dehydrogenase (short-subunit alcohol dehydrogenase family)
MEETRNALVTGARRGIGKAIAIELARGGYNIVLNANTTTKPGTSDGNSPHQRLPEVKREIEALGRKAWICPADIGKETERRALVEFAEHNAGIIHLLVNNAGVGPEKREDILSTSEESFDRVISINLRGTFFFTQTIAKKMVEKAKSGYHYPFKIINISSISGYTSSPSRSEYCISKAGVSMITKLFADRLAEYGINVYEIRPGIIATDMTRGVKDSYDKLIEQGLTPIKRWGTPEDVAKAVGAVASGALDFSTGEVLNVDGGFHLRRL